MKTIIVATDYSPEANNAAEYAAAFAAHVKAKIVLFNAYSLPHHTANSILPAKAIAKLEENNKRLLQKRADELREKYGVETSIHSGLFLLLEEELEEQFTRHNADLVVFGMAPKSIEQDLFGNTTTSVMLQMKYPVLAVPAHAKFSKPDSILFASDNIQKVHPDIKNNLVKLATKLDTVLEVFHVDAPSEIATQEKVKEVPEFAEIKHVFRTKESEDVIKAIETEIKSGNPGMLIMIPRKYGLWESLVHRSKTRIMASGLSIPLLSIPEK